MPGHLREAPCLNAPFCTDAQRVQLPSPHIAHDQVLEHLLEKIRAGFHEDMIHRAQRRGAVGQSLRARPRRYRRY